MKSVCLFLKKDDNQYLVQFIPTRKSMVWNSSKWKPKHKHDFYMDYESALVLFREAKMFEKPEITRIDYLTNLTGVPRKTIENFFAQNALNIQDLEDLKKGKTILRFATFTKYDKREGLRRLLEEFLKNPRPLKDELSELSKEFGTNEKNIQDWFNKKRLELGISTRNFTYESLRQNYDHSRFKNRKTMTAMGKASKILKEEFARSQYISPAKTQEIADRCGLKYKQVQTYFQTQRCKTGNTEGSFRQKLTVDEKKLILNRMKENPHLGGQGITDLATEIGKSWNQVNKFVLGERRKSKPTLYFISAEQKEILLKFYAQQNNLNDLERRVEIHKATGLSVDTIFNFFNGQRVKDGVKPDSTKGSCQGSNTKNHRVPYAKNVLRKEKKLLQEFKVAEGFFEKQKVVTKLSNATGVRELLVKNYLIKTKLAKKSDFQGKVKYLR